VKILKEWYRKLVPLRGSDTTPPIVLMRTLDKADRMKAVIVVIQWNDGSYDMDWSSMPASTLAVATILMQEQTKRNIVGIEAPEYDR